MPLPFSIRIGPVPAVAFSTLGVTRIIVTGIIESLLVKSDIATLTRSGGERTECCGSQSRAPLSARLQSRKVSLFEFPFLALVFGRLFSTACRRACA